MGVPGPVGAVKAVVHSCFSGISRAGRVFTGLWLVGREVTVRVAGAAGTVGVSRGTGRMG